MDIQFIKKKSIALTVGTICLVQAASAFDVHTHGVMTSEGVAQSNFSQNSVLLKNLGIVDPEWMSIRRYLDIGSTVVMRDRNKIQEDVIALIARQALALVIPDPYTARGWFIQGVIREDDNTVETTAPDGDEPGGVFNRVYGHFFDPFTNRGLTIAGVTVGARAMDWALAPSATVGLGNKNHFKISDAREAM